MSANHNTVFPGTVTAPTFAGTATYAQSAGVLQTTDDLRNKMTVRPFASGSNTNKGAIFLQEDLGSGIVNVGIDGLGSVGVNLAAIATRAYRDIDGNLIGNTYAKKTDIDTGLRYLGEQKYDAYGGAGTITFPNAICDLKHQYIVTVAGCSSTSSSSGNYDSWRVFLVTPRNDTKNWTFMTLGSVGDTARCSVQQNSNPLAFTVTKGSFVIINLYELSIE